MENNPVTLSDPNLAIPEAVQTPTQPVKLDFMLAITIAIVTLYLCYIAISSLLLPFQIGLLAPANKVVILSTFTGISVLVALVANPVAGALSDRTTSSFGRRRPWICVGGLLMAVSLFTMWQASSLPLLFVGWCGVQLFSNCALAAITATIPDRVPENQRGAVSGIFSLAISIGAILGAILVGQVFKAAPTNVYLVMIVAVLVACIPLGVFLPDKVLPKGYLPFFRLGAFIKSFWINPQQHPDFVRAWLTRFFPLIGLVMANNYILYYLQDAVKYPFPLQEASTFYIIWMVIGIISALLGGFLSDRLRRRKPFVILAASILAVAMLFLGFFQSWQFVLVAAGMLGLGIGTYNAVDVAIITQVLPSAEGRAKDMGVANIAATLPQALAPLIAGVILSLSHNYMLLYLAGAVFTLLGIIVVVPIKAVR